MIKWLKEFWIQFTLFEINVDFESENSIEIGTIIAGSGNGPTFSGSFFLFYIEVEPFHDPMEPHIIWDFLWLRQFFTKIRG